MATTIVVTLAQLAKRRAEIENELGWNDALYRIAFEESKTDANLDDYLEGLAEDRQDLLDELDSVETQIEGLKLAVRWAD